MRRILLGVAAIAGFSLLAPSAQGQTAGFSDPFFLYYGWYVPYQANQASLPRAEDTVRAFSAQRQMTAVTERSQLFDPIGSLDEYDPLRTFGPEGGRTPLPATTPTGIVHTHVNGAGPAGYYNRVNTYYPTLRLGRGANQSLSPISRSPRTRNLRGGGFGMSSPFGNVPRGVRVPGR